MRFRSLTLAGAVLASSALLAVGAEAAGAPTGPPPPPTATNGATVTQVAAGLFTPTSFAFGDGSVFEGDGGASSGPPNGGVFLLKGGTATKIPGSPGFVAGLAWHQGALYVSGGFVTGAHSAKWQLLKWSGWNGTTFTQQKAIYTAPKKFAGFNGLAFSPTGRLYVGVDTGLTNNNDHGPAKTPYVYDILSIKPTGKDLKVFATGMRQPWQLVFPHGSGSPLVSNLGQDRGVKNPPDFVLKVRQGQNYGFPQCTWLKPSKCSGFAKPFKFFAAHTDIMGMAIIGSRLYMTEFTGPRGKGPGGEVVSMPVSGGPVKPVLTGFVAPIVGLGAQGGMLYVGEVTGQVFSVKP